MTMKRFFIALVGAALVALGSQAARATPVALELSLVVDLSGSVDPTERDLQLQGYADAFNNAAIQAEIAAATGGIAVNLITFGTTASEVIGWTHLTDATSAAAFATAIETFKAGAGSLGSTNIAHGIDLGISGIAGNGFEGTRLVIDVSGDGTQNVRLDGTGGTGAEYLADLTGRRDAAAAAGITINGLPILTDVATLGTYYDANVVTADGFVLPATDFSTFGAAVALKIESEISGENPIPEPATLLAFGAGLLGLGLVRRRRG